MPIMLMLLFVYLFGGAIQTGGDYVTYVVPGVILLCAGFGAAQTAVSVSQDMNGGIIDRFRSMDVGGAAVIAGHVVASVLRNLVATVAGVRGGAAHRLPTERRSAGRLGAAGILLLSSWPSRGSSAAVGPLGPLARGGRRVQLPRHLPALSEQRLCPVDTMPGWIRGFATNQPVTPVIKTLRGLLLGLPLGTSPLRAVAWCLGILVASVAVSGVLFRLRTT